PPGSRPQLDRGFRLACPCAPRFRNSDDGFLLAAGRTAHHRLPDGDNLAGLGKRSRAHAFGIGPKICLVYLDAPKVVSAPRTREPAFGFIRRRLLAIEVGDRGPAAGLQSGIAVEV